MDSRVLVQLSDGDSVPVIGCFNYLGTEPVETENTINISVELPMWNNTMEPIPPITGFFQLISWVLFTFVDDKLTIAGTQLCRCRDQLLKDYSTSFRPAAWIPSWDNIAQKRWLKCEGVCPHFYCDGCGPSVKWVCSQDCSDQLLGLHKQRETENTHLGCTRDDYLAILDSHIHSCGWKDIIYRWDLAGYAPFFYCDYPTFPGEEFCSGHTRVFKKRNETLGNYAQLEHFEI
jgi:predicted nucleic acid-binding Zn ribbon protein